VIVHEGIRDEITLRVEMKPDWPAESWDELSDALHRRLGHAHEGLNFQIERAGAGELPRFELKAKRMIDLRESPAVVSK
jgi:phenylacetate-CoA ligase